MNASILISGAGIGGSTLAYWLGRNGFDVTVVERAAGQRSSGNPIDVRGAALPVVEVMGIMPELRAAATHVDRLTFVDAAGRRKASMRTTGGRAGESGEVELARAELAAILLESAKGRARMYWGDSISGIAQDEAGVDVTFEHAPPERFDYVIGADGLHSAVRRLVFGDERDFVRHMGMYVATLPVDRTFGGDREVVMYNEPGRSVSVHPAGGKPLAAFMFRSPAVPDYNYRDTAQHKSLVLDAFDGRTGIFGELLDQVRAAEDLYFDAVSRVSLPRWTKGRVTLLGDAGSSLSLFGDGSSLAITGAHTLAEELTRTPGDSTGALSRYEQRQRALAKPALRGFRTASMLIVPGSRLAITLRDTAIRVVSRW
ncbi:FAD-dependent monooxygenase [Nocardia yamanashiensis]|uniref:FAD-dependent monooxygenase n=1 Tax=Nocardia yamanashiensis TaxID=209247 RepID=UPI001E53C2A8|nr:FAD-dependent monooxygenase [Nocardia yamanashiensis]UGT42110.1 FAD-dependent monooxygenase [Nocardia yamanashiensis]